MKNLHLRFNINENRSDDEIYALIETIKNIYGINLLHFILSGKTYNGGYKICIIEVEVDDVSYDVDGETSVEVNAIFGAGVTALGKICTWISEHEQIDYVLSISDTSIVDTILSTIKDKTKNSALKKILVTTEASAIVGNFKLSDIPYDTSTSELI